MVSFLMGFANLFRLRISQLRQADKARRVMECTRIFSEGCGNTIVPKRHPVLCPDCTEQFLTQIKKAIR